MRGKIPGGREVAEGMVGRRSVGGVLRGGIPEGGRMLTPSASATPLIRKGWLQQCRSCMCTFRKEGPVRASAP
eukprot:scaffold8714_cov40-Isochrysis_galbana.AAC.1